MSPRLKKALGEKWTLNGHHKSCFCNSCYVWKRAQGYGHGWGTIDDHNYPMMIYRHWWARPVLVLVIIVIYIIPALRYCR